ncbi:hypothetical protein BDK51DRAFT_39051 [Blyttiomyces helicus]|uniref:Secreted protein n=1 Tax=Blyttiomyces helicus TaxID=388810 RepID=A0A4P9W9X7_9FUNG|nr:hypothetical protein BDK51DRAFT_39051 [Blyttiomyces helicus]|eukprot:RKO87948.1 hypothetical protein BDK51DRAFT_39051 [Blyttiomyces helicus]
MSNNVLSLLCFVTVFEFTSKGCGRAGGGFSQAHLKHPLPNTHPDLDFQTEPGAHLGRSPPDSNVEPSPVRVDGRAAILRPYPFQLCFAVSPFSRRILPPPPKNPQRHFARDLGRPNS